MKHIKHYKIFESTSPNFPTTREEVIEACERYEIKNYTINDDLSIDVNDDVYLYRQNLEYLPLKFNYVDGNFNCSDNKLKTLEGCPRTVGSYFSCSVNQLKTLEGCPQTINGDFDCSENELVSLESCPQTVDGYFSCSFNELETLEGCPQTVDGVFACSFNELETLEGCPQTVDGNFDCGNNKLVSLKGCPQTVGGNFDCSVNYLVSLEGSPQTVSGGFNCKFNKLTDLEHFPEVNGRIDIEENIVNSLVYTFIKNADSFLIEDFIDYEIVRNRDTVMLDRLKTFIEGFGLEMPNLKEIKKRYKIIE
jgi:hypothetical protein